MAGLQIVNGGFGETIRSLAAERAAHLGEAAQLRGCNPECEVMRDFGTAAFEAGQVVLGQTLEIREGIARFQRIDKTTSRLEYTGFGSRPAVIEGDMPYPTAEYQLNGLQRVMGTDRVTGAILPYYVAWGKSTDERRRPGVVGFDIFELGDRIV